MMKKLICIIYVAVLIVMGAATFVEAAEGTPFVHREIYGTWWFTALWTALAVFGAIYIIRCKALWRKATRNLSVLLLHAAFLVILAGALLTHLTGRSGTIHLRLGEPQDIAEIEQNGEKYYHRLNFNVELTDFQVIEDEEGNSKDYRSAFRILSKAERPVLGDSIAEPLSVSMNNIAKHGSLRFYQMSYDYDRRGSTLMINRDPYGIPVTYCGYGLLFLSFIWLVVRGNRGEREGREIRERRGFRHYRVLGATLLLTAAWCVYYFVLDGSWAKIPVLRHPLLIFHVVIIILAYALLLIQTIVSAATLLKGLKGLKVIKDLNDPNGLNIPKTQILRWALCLLSIGIFLGAIWANISWGNYWTWDSKETWALITLMIYAVPLHKRSLSIFSRPRVYHVYMLFAFMTVLMTYFGVNYFLTGMHSYG